MSDENKKEVGYILTVKESKDGEEYFKICGENKISGYKFMMNSPDEVETKADNIMAELHIKGKFNDEEDDNIPKKIVDWCLINKKAGSIAFKYLQFDYVVGDLVKRRYIFPNAFVVDFVETREYDDDTSEGAYFDLFVKQNKDQLKSFEMETGLQVE